MNNAMIENWKRQRDRMDELINSYQNMPTNPINNFINTQTPNKDLIEWRILNENEEVDNLYVQNKTLFINDNTMVLKGVDGKLEKWTIKKTWPIDKKDEKINALEEEIKKLKEVINNEYSKSVSTDDECIKSDVNVDGDVKSKSKTTSKSISK